MPLTLVLIIAVIAIAALALLLNRLGFSAPARLKDARTAHTFFEKETPDVRVDAVVLSGDGRTALLTLQGDDRRLGFIQCMGDGYMTRLLGPGDLVRVDKSPENVLSITFSDFTCPRAQVHIEPSSALSEALSRLSRITRVRPENRTPESALSEGHS